MRILVTGASGFVGQHVCQLLAKNHTVIPLDRACGVDLRNLPKLKFFMKTVGAVDQIIHLAASVPKSPADDNPDNAAANDEGTRNLLIAAGRLAKGFVYASTVEVYGTSPLPQPINELSQIAPVSWYAKSKYAGEIMTTAFAKKHNLPVSIVRLSVLYGAGDQINRAIPNFIKAALANQLITVFGGEELRDFLHVTDAAQALIDAALVNVPGTYVAGSGKTTSIIAAATLVRDLVSPSAQITILPRNKSQYDLALDCSKAASTLKYKPQYQFPDRLEEMILWQKKNLS